MILARLYDLAALVAGPPTLPSGRTLSGRRHDVSGHMKPGVCEVCSTSHLERASIRSGSTNDVKSKIS